MTNIPDQVVAWKPIETAPKDGRVIVVMQDDCGSFPMAWNPTATNSMFAPGEIGMWEMIDKSMTWREGDGCGPTHWQPLAPPEFGK